MKTVSKVYDSYAQARSALDSGNADPSRLQTAIIQKRLQRENILEKARKDSEAFFHSLVESLPQNILRKDKEGRYTFANQRYCTTMGKPLHQIIGKTSFDLLPAELSEKDNQDDRWVMETGDILETVEEHPKPNGSHARASCRARGRPSP